MTSLIAFIILIGVLITVHELGHFIVAKLCGVRVHTFSVGFGQPIFSKTIGETEYRIAWLPLGGYVRLHGMLAEFGEVSDDSTASDDSENMNLSDDPDAERGVYRKPPWMRALIFIAGPAMNLLLPFVLLPPFFYYATDFSSVLSSLTAAVDQGLPAYKAGVRSGDRIVEINGKPIYAFWQVAQVIDGYEPGTAPLNIKLERPGVSESLNLEVTPEQLTETLRFLGFKETHNRIGFQPYALAADLISIKEDSLFSRAGGQRFDRIVAMNGDPLHRFYELAPRILASPIDRPISLTVERGRPLELGIPYLQERYQKNITLPAPKEWLAALMNQDANLSDVSRPERVLELLGVMQASPCISSVKPDSPAASQLKVGDCILSVDGQAHSLPAFLSQRLYHEPEQSKQLVVLRAGQSIQLNYNLRAVTHNDPMAGEIKDYVQDFTFLGSIRTDAFLKGDVVKNYERWAFAWSRTKDKVFTELKRSLMTLGGMFTGAVSPTQLSGPVTIFYVAGKQAEAGFSSFLGLMVILSLSLGLINLVPIPGLDGGHILIAGLEMIIRRPLPSKVRQGLQLIGVFCILALVLFALGNDIMRMWRLSQG